MRRKYVRSEDINVETKIDYKIINSVLDMRIDKLLEMDYSSIKQFLLDDCGARIILGHDLCPDDIDFDTYLDEFTTEVIDVAYREAFIRLRESLKGCFDRSLDFDNPHFYRMMGWMVQSATLIEAEQDNAENYERSQTAKKRVTRFFQSDAE